MLRPFPPFDCQMTDNQIQQTACILSAHYHGRQSCLLSRVAGQADDCLDRGDMPGFRLWKRIEVAIQAAPTR